VSNSRSFRRRLSAAPASPAAAADPEQPPRQPWNKGRVLTSAPSLSTTRRWLEGTVSDGFIKREVARTGKPGRPAIMYQLTEDGRERAAALPPHVMRIQADRVRREENARKRRKAVRDAAALKALGEKAARAGQRVHAAEAALRKAEAKVERLTAETIARATEALTAADGDASALSPYEADVLLEHGCAYREGSKLLLTREYGEALREAQPAAN
jgi:DNA-binding PadR family transcriptional regulator